MLCAICRIRRPRRFCPGVRGDICSICCGTEREVTVDCPLDCEYLQQARRHEKPVPVDPEKVPNRDIQLSEKLLAENQELLVFLGKTVVDAALATRGAADADVREALDGLARTWRTLERGVYYESLPTNPLAANMYHMVQSAIAEFRREETGKLGLTRTRDSHVLRYLVFLQRLELSHNNGRPRGRAFLSALLEFYGAGRPSFSPAASSLILP